jgi:hypothetical protein
VIRHPAPLELTIVLRLKPLLVNKTTFPRIQGDVVLYIKPQRTTIL